VRRIAIAMIVTKAPFIHRPISLFRHIDQFLKLNPLLKAPTLLTDDGAALMDSSVILDYLAGVDPRIAALTPSRAPERLAALRATGVALTVMEKAVQRHYERTLRPADKRHQPWVDRVMGQLTAGLDALDGELPASGWIGGDMGMADITVVCAVGFADAVLADVVELSRYSNLKAFCARAEALPAFRAAPPQNGARARAIGD
jgi:glutathione S-transferase